MMIFQICSFINQNLIPLELKKDNDNTDYLLRWKSNGVYTFKFKPFYTAFLHSIKRSGYKVKIKLNNDTLVEEQYNHATKILNAYIVYHLGNWPDNPLENMTLKNCLFVATSIVKAGDKEKWVHNGYRIGFDGNVSLSFGNDFARNVVTFDIDNSLPSHANNFKNNFSLLGEGDTFGINGRFRVPEKKV